MKDNIDIEKLFSDKLANHESVVNSNIWSGIQSQIGVGASSTAVAAKGVSIAAKWIIGITSVVAVSALIVVLNYGETKQDTVLPDHKVTDSTLSVVEDQELDIKSIVESTVVPNNINSDLGTNSEGTHTASIIRADKNGESSSLESSSPDKLIVKQQETPSVRAVLPVSSLKKDKVIVPALSSEKKYLNAEAIPKEITSKGTLQEWKKTNVFSPNNDGVNDLFFLETIDIKEFSITIINENNTVVFISDDPSFKWDGTDYRTGEMVPEGNYGYIVFAVDIYNNPFKLFNTLKISR